MRWSGGGMKRGCGGVVEAGSDGIGSRKIEVSSHQI